MTEPDHTCTPPDPGTGPVVMFYTCPECGRTWLLHRSDDGDEEWRRADADPGVWRQAPRRFKHPFGG